MKGKVRIMCKHTLETKLAAVKMIQEEGRSHGSVARELDVGKVTVQRWLALYNAYGEEGLLLKRQKYSGDFKAHVVEYVLNNNISYFKAAVLFKVRDTMIAYWVKLATKEGTPALYESEGQGVSKVRIKHLEVKSDEYDSMNRKELLEEIERLGCENAYLKKLDALLQEKEKSQKKIK